MPKSGAPRGAGLTCSITRATCRMSGGGTEMVRKSARRLSGNTTRSAPPGTAVACGVVMHAHPIRRERGYDSKHGGVQSLTERRSCHPRKARRVRLIVEHSHSTQRSSESRSQLSWQARVWESRLKGEGVHKRQRLVCLPETKGFGPCGHCLPQRHQGLRQHREHLRGGADAGCDCQ